MNAVAKRLEEIPKLLDVCGRVGKALVETGQEWWASGFFALATDFQRARDNSMAKLRALERDLRKVRSADFSPEAIRDTARVRTFLKACQDCREANEKGIAQGVGFICLACEQPGSQDGADSCEPDAEGTIIESR